MKKILFIILTGALAACTTHPDYYDDGFQTKTHEYEQPKIPDDPLQLLSMNCADWYIYAEDFGNTMMLTAKKIYSAPGGPDVPNTFHSEMVRTDPIDGATASYIDKSQPGQTPVAFSVKNTSDGAIYILSFSNNENKNNTWNYKYICNPIYTDINSQ